MPEIENKLKDIIIKKFGSVRSFSNFVDLPYTTVDSILKRGIAKSNALNLHKIGKALDLDITALFNGKIEFSRSDSWEPDFTSKDERDVQKELERTLNSLQNDTGLMFDGEILDDETRELLEASLEHAIRTAKIAAKKKFTPNKYKKDPTD